MKEHLSTSCFVFETPSGWMVAAFRGCRVCGLELPVSSRQEAAARCAIRGNDAPCAETLVEMERLADEMRRYFAGERIEFSVGVALDGLTDWRRRVLTKSAEIPYGEVMTYGQLAADVGSPKASRAVGQAMAANPVPIIVPCHRVVAASGSLGGFSGGIEWKRRLLALEGVEFRCI